MQENITHNEEKNQAIETYPEMTEVLQAEIDQYTHTHAHTHTHIQSTILQKHQGYLVEKQ